MEIAQTKKQEEENPMENLSQGRRKENSCFDHKRRLLLEGYLLGSRGFPKITGRTELARIFRCDRKTIYNEIKRGLVEHTKSDLSKVLEYNADYAQQAEEFRGDLCWRHTKSIGAEKNICKRFKMCYSV